MFVARIDLQLGQHGPAELVLWHHAFDRFLDNPFGCFINQLVKSDGFNTTGVTGVVMVKLVSRLIAGHNDLFGVNNNDIVAGVHMWCELWLMLAAQAIGNLSAEAPESLIGSVHDIPAALHFFFLGTKSLHYQTLII